jgi:hypothetical protein
MGYVIGTDEAGYGPNLGPLLITATVWGAPDGTDADGLFDLLKGVVGRARPAAIGRKAMTGKKPPARGKHGSEVPVFGDSKALYTSGHGLHRLEHGLWAAWDLLGWDLRTWRDVWQKLAPAALEHMESSLFYSAYDQELPRDWEINGDAKPNANGTWRAKFAQTGVKLLSIRSRAVFPEEFNRLMDRHESKGAALSNLTLGLVADVLKPLEKGPISVLCDKHGGRDHYAALLNEHFFDGFVEVRGEGRQLSTYRFGPPERRIEFQFRAKAESCLPAALASMASKYLRELAMAAFNAFWISHLPDLAPTAGYPDDARRFQADIAAKQRELGIDDAVLWRKK